MAAQQPSQAFEQLHEEIRRWIWRQGWCQLREVQERAVEPILSADKDIILMAATAGGKTEAAFLPICSRLVGRAVGSVHALYVSPLKALINDQFGRLELLCERLTIPVHRWHGDVPSSRKRSLVKDPSGILLITPESLEALFVLHGTQVGRIFHDLDYVVIDELHSFIGNERGRQLQSLLHRLDQGRRRSVPRIALSATLGDVTLAAEFLRRREGRKVMVIQSHDSGRELRLQLRGYRITPPKLDPAEQGTPSEPERSELEDRSSPEEIAIGMHVFESLRGSDNLVFANARARVEEYADLLRRMSERERVPNEFFPHHGNLSKELREEVEELLKKKDRPLTAVCTSTLELGIDIGTVKSIAQIGAPPSVASMRQRLGRSGRREDDPAILRIYIAEPEITAESPPSDTLYAELVQSIAMVNLLIENWYEPPTSGALHLSTLVQQTLSLIAQHGGITAQNAWTTLCKTGPFSEIDAATYAAFLHGLGGHDLIMQAKDGTLLLGGLGEHIVNHYSFYAAFTTPEEYRLVTGGQTLGTLPISYPLTEGGFLIFAGQRWKIVSVDPVHKVVDLTPAPGGRIPIFGGTGGIVHDRVRQEMLAVYSSGDIPAFLDATARDLLLEARTNFARLGLVERSVIQAGKDAVFFCWMGDRVINTLVLQLRGNGLRVSQEDLAITAKCSVDELTEVLTQLAAQRPADALQLAMSVADKLTEKYDRYLPEELLVADYASRYLDSSGASASLNRLFGERSPASV